MKTNASVITRLSVFSTLFKKHVSQETLKITHETVLFTNFPIRAHYLRSHRTIKILHISSKGALW